MQIHKPITTVILVVITAVLIFLFVFPKYQEFSGVQVSLAKKQAEYNGESQYYQKIGEAIKQIDDRKDMLGKIDSSLPMDSSVAPVLYFFQAKGLETGLLIKSVTFSDTAVVAEDGVATTAVTPKIVKDILFNVSLTGNYAGLKNFLTGLENSARLFEVDSISLTPLQSLRVGSQNEGQAYDVKLLIKTHTY